MQSETQRSSPTTRSVPILRLLRGTRGYPHKARDQTQLSVSKEMDDFTQRLVPRIQCECEGNKNSSSAIFRRLFQGSKMLLSEKLSLQLQYMHSHVFIEIFHVKIVDVHSQNNNYALKASTSRSFRLDGNIRINNFKHVTGTLAKAQNDKKPSTIHSLPSHIEKHCSYV